MKLFLRCASRALLVLASPLAAASGYPSYSNSYRLPEPPQVLATDARRAPEGWAPGAYPPSHSPQSSAHDFFPAPEGDLVTGSLGYPMWTGAVSGTDVPPSAAPQAKPWEESPGGYQTAAPQGGWVFAPTDSSPGRSDSVQGYRFRPEDMTFFSSGDPRPPADIGSRLDAAGYTDREAPRLNRSPSTGLPSYVSDPVSMQAPYATQAPPGSDWNDYPMEYSDTPEYGTWSRQPQILQPEYRFAPAPQTDETGQAYGQTPRYESLGPAGDPYRFAPYGRAATSQGRPGIGPAPEFTSSSPGDYREPPPQEPRHGGYRDSYARQTPAQNRGFSDPSWNSYRYLPPRRDGGASPLQSQAPVFSWSRAPSSPAPDGVATSQPPYGWGALSYPPDDGYPRDWH